jgi:hypothetical protein
MSVGLRKRPAKHDWPRIITTIIIADITTTTTITIITVDGAIKAPRSVDPGAVLLFAWSS